MESMNLWQRINAVMKDVEYLNKDDTVSAGASGSYKGISEEKVTAVVGSAMRKHGLVIFPIEQEHSRTDETIKDKYGNDKINRITTVNTKYKIINVDKPEEYEIVTSSGTGVDTQDKGVGKAMTYAYKYLLLRTFAIATGEDADKVSSEVYSDKLKCTLSEDKIKRLFSLAYNAGFDTAKVNSQIKRKFNKNVPELTDEEYEVVCAGYEKINKAGKDEN